MKHKMKTFVVTMLLVPMTMLGQNYQSLWRQVEDAQSKDLPQTAIAALRKIETKADREKAYGQLLKATLLHSRLQAAVSPDSLQPAVDRLMARHQAVSDDVLRAVYATVLSQVYADNHTLENWESRRLDYWAQALAHPERLAQVSAADYVPFVVSGKDSELYAGDLLSVVGSELEAWQVLSQYYSTTGNRRAACMATLRWLQQEAPRGRETLARSAYVARLDSLVSVYGDLPECCEVAIARYDYMTNHTDATASQRYEWLRQSVERWGTWKGANRLRNSMAELTLPTFHVDMSEQVGEVQKGQTLSLTGLRHLRQLTMRVYRTSLEGDTRLNPDDRNDYQQVKAGLTELREMGRTLTFTGHEDYEVFADSMQLEALPPGVYLLEFSSQPATEVVRTLYFVSGVRLISQAMPGDQMRYVVVNATTGQPLSHATVRLSFDRGWKEPKDHKQLVCNGRGEVIYKADGKRPSGVFAFSGTDKYCPEVDASGRYTYYEHKYNVEHISLFTDRSIYRPGQTVHVAVIAWKEVSALENKAVEGRQLTLELRDANYKVVAEQRVTTDRFGKCGAMLALPAGLLNGRFTVKAGNSSTSIRVEEYRRPTFQVEFPEHKEPYRQGDIVHAQARAVTYAGVPVQGARVKYTVRRRIAFWWMTCSNYWQSVRMGRSMQDELLCDGEATTGDDGKFVVDVPMTLPDEAAGRSMFYHFTVEADVTDMAGETHSGTLTLPLGTHPTVLTCDLPQKVRADQMTAVNFSRRNAAGAEIDGRVRYRIDGGKWRECAANTQHADGQSHPDLEQRKLSTLKSGKHHLEAVCEQDTLEMSFVVFSLDDKRPAAQTDDWFYVSDTQFPADGKAVTVQVGSSDPDLHIVYGIFAGSELVESGAIDKDAALENRKFRYDDDYGNGLLLTYAWVKNGQCHTHQTYIRRPIPDKRLKMEWTTFRDRLTPGQQEEWRLKVSQPDGTPAQASLMAVLYDKSLDAINPHQWTFSPNTYLAQPSTGWTWRAWGHKYLGASEQMKWLDTPEQEYSSFDHSVYPEAMMWKTYVRGSRFMKSAAAPQMMTARMEMAAVSGSSDEAMANGVMMARDEVQTDAAQEATEGRTEQTQVRENLQETAFCYPVVEADEQGEAVLHFTLPESLTTWRFMGVANTTDMLYGQIEAETVARKDVMIQPNVPRFLRMGDEARLTARVFNTSGKTVSGKARLVLIDPECDRVVHEQSADFSVAEGKTASVVFTFTPDETWPILICKVTAEGNGFSDGEQHYLPILPDREMVVRTVPFTQHEPGVKTVELSRLFPEGTSQQKLTVEYTNNPAWLMVQSLPTLGQPWEHSAFDQAASYYSNLLAKTLLSQSPQVKTTIGLWKREGTDLSGQQSRSAHGQGTLVSQLSKNEELKDLVLAETPWVAAADRESEQRWLLADFFDENSISHRMSTAVEKLKKLQNSDGSFSWFAGMQGSMAVTVSVQEMLTRLNVMAGPQQDTHQMQDKAFDYMGRQMLNVVAELKKQKNPTFPSFAALRWLYVCAIDGRTLPARVKTANNYLLTLLKKDVKRQTIYEKALTAIVLARNGDSKTARQYVQSLKEYSVCTEEMGRYYDTRRAAYSWYDYKIPTEVAAIEAIQTVTPQDRQTTDEMRRWLLQEKRTQVWDTPINSVNAIYAFLNGNSTLLASREQTALCIDGKPLSTEAAPTAGLGYVKTAVSQPKGSTFTATKTSEGTSWGAVYAQFLQKSTEVEAHGSGIKVEREILSVNPQLKVGDRIRVRITITADRDLDFVHVVDRRASCMEPVTQLSGYRNGAYCSPKDFATNYYYYGLAKGRHVIETEYYIDRAGHYETGTCTAGCAYAPAFRGTAPSININVTE